MLLKTCTQTRVRYHQLIIPVLQREGPRTVFVYWSAWEVEACMDRAEVIGSSSQRWQVSL